MPSSESSRPAPPFRATRPCPENTLNERKPFIAGVRAIRCLQHKKIFRASRRRRCKKKRDFHMDEKLNQPGKKFFQTGREGRGILSEQALHKDMRVSISSRLDLLASSLGHPRGLSEVLPREDGLVAELLLDTQKLWQRERRGKTHGRGRGRRAKETASKRVSQTKRSAVESW